MKWDIVATVKETPEVMERFVAHHILLGVNRIWLFFDDPNDPSADKLDALDAVQATRCDVAHWQGLGGTPRTIERKQMRNARFAYGRSDADWIIHIDSDEFVEADRPLADILAEATSPVLRLEPFEMLRFPRSGQTAEPTHMFRGPLPTDAKGVAAAEAAYGPFEKVLRRGMLSHIAGKFFVRTRQEGMALRIHVPEIDGRRIGGETLPDARLLHLHGGDWREWRSKMRMRLKHGAYTAKQDQRKSLRLGKEATINHVLYELLGTEGEAGVKRFYDRICTYDRSKKILRSVGAMHRSSMWLEQKRAAVFGYASDFRDMAVSRETGLLEAVVDVDGTPICIQPDVNVDDRAIALGLYRVSEEAQTLLAEVEGKKTGYLCLGERPPVIATKALKIAAAGSRAVFATFSETRASLFRKNLASNDLANADVVVLGTTMNAQTASLGDIGFVAGGFADFDTAVLEVSFEDSDAFSPDMLSSLAKEAGVKLIHLQNSGSEKSKQMASLCCGDGHFEPVSDALLRRR